MKILKPVLAALLFFTLTVYFTYYYNSSLLYLHFNQSSQIALFISAPFNISVEGNPLYNLFIPTVLIFVLGIYLKNFNKAFRKKCNFRSIFIISIIASYISSVLSMNYYIGYADFGISLGTSIITLSFIAAFVISLEVYIEHKEKYEYLYGHFMFVIISSLILLLAVITIMSYFVATNSSIVHLMGLTTFLIIFITYYERSNIIRFIHKEEKVLIKEEKALARKEKTLIKRKKVLTNHKKA